MKTTIQRLAQGATRLAVAALAALAAGGAWAAAPTPTVVWDGDFSSLTKTVGNVTYTIGNVTGTGVSTTTANSVGSDKSYLQIANHNKDVAAPIITATGGDSAFGNATDGATVLIFASGMPLTATSNRALLLLMDNTGTYGKTPSGKPTAYSRFGIARAKGNNYGGNAAGGFVLNGSIDTANAPVNLAAYTDGKQSIALTYKGSSGLKYYVDGSLKGEYNPNADFTPTGVCIGGVDYTNSDWFYAQNRMKIHAIAIFNRELTAEEIAEYEEQSRFRYCDAIAWRNAGNSSTEFHASTFASVGSIGEAANSTTRTYNTTEFPWSDSFSTGKLPVALIYDQANKQQSVAANFSGLWIGGVYVNATPASGTYTITAGTGGTRETYLGDKTGNHESWFVFNESYTISRSGASNTANSLLYGTVNMYIAADKTFTLNSGASTSAKNLVMTAGTANAADPVFRMSGGGKLVVPHLNASAGTLDFSGVTAAPFIQGNLTVTAATKLVLPSGLAAETAYQICTGVLTAPTVVQGATVRIGDGEEQEVILMYDTTAKTVKYYTSFPEYNGMVSGTTITWDTEPTSEQMALGIVNLTGSGEVTLAVQPAAVNAGSGVTVDVTGYTTAGLSGAGTFKYTSGYPTTVPEGVTYEYVGGTEESPCASSDKYTVNGTLKLNGYFTLSGANTVPNASGVLEIASGKSTVTFGSNTAGVTGWIQIDSGAELVAASSDALNYDSNSGGVKVYGKLSLGSYRWSFNTNNKFYLYNGGEVSGEGDSTHHCALDFYQSNRILVFGTCTISANVRTRDSDDLLTIAQARGSSLTISGNIIGSGAVKKDYATMAEGNTENNAGNSTTYFSGANTFGGAFTAADNTGYIIMCPGVAFNSATAFTIGTGNELDFGKSDGTDSASAIEFNNTVSNGGATKVYCKLTLRSSANATIWGDNFTGTVQVESTGGLVVPATCTGESSTCNFSIVSGGKLYGGGTVVLNAFPTLTTSVLDSGWTGKVVFPAITSGGADNDFNQKVNAFGNTASTVKLLELPTAGNSTYFSDNGSVNTTLELAEGCTLRINNGYSAVDPGKTGTIYNLTGAGTLLHAWSPSPSDKMFKISVTTVSNFTGSVQNTSSVTGCDINIGKLHFDSKPVGGARVLSATASGTGKITVGGTNINGLILVQKSDGFYAAAASYNGENYATIQDAIDAAEQAGQTYAAVTILDPNATCPAGYYIDTEDNNVLKKYAAAAVTVVGATATTNGFTTFQAAIDAAVADNQTTYAVAYADGTATASGTGANVFMLMPNGYDVTVMCSVAGYGAYAQGQEIPGFAGVYPYSAVAAAATFTWTGAAEDGGLWATAGNWSSADGTVAAAPANSLYTVVLNTAATIKLDGLVAIGTVNVGAAVTLNHVYGKNATLDASSIVLTAAGASLAKHDDQNSMTLAVVPTTTVANSYVKATVASGTTTYVVDAYNTVTFAGANMTATRTDGRGDAIKDGDTITFTIAPESGYAVTSVTASSGEVTKSNGVYSYTVTENATITVTTVSAAVTIGEATFEYYAGYAKAKSVTATVSSGTVVEGTTWTLTVGENSYSGTYDSTSGTVTFAPEGGISGISVGSNAYTITASGGSTGSARSTTVAGTETSGWIQEDSDHRETTGAWNDGNGTAIDITYSGDVAAFSGTNTYTAAASGNGIVTLTTVVKFGGEADPEVQVGDDAQAAIRIQTVDSTLKFQVYGKTKANGTAGWQTTDVQATEDTTYTVSLTINYTTGTFTASVQASEAGSATPLGGPWYLATAATKISAVAYKGTGEFTSLNGSFISGDIAVTVTSQNDVSVSSEFISQYLSTKTVSDAAAALNPNATQESNPEAFAANGNGINYFTCYALGLDPTEKDDKLVVDVSTDENGNFVFTVKHPIFDGENIIGYEPINAADNVQATVTYKYGTTVDGDKTSITGDKISPSEMFNNQSGNLLYSKAEVSIGAK